ncbi:MAG TPA: TniB family NTP-binding protein [Allosphingosinicella sp.]|jgi:hypothetical protein
MSKRTGPWVDQDPSLRRRIANGIFVERKECQEVIAKLNLVRRNMLEGAEPTSISVVGKAGVGKTRLLRQYCDSNPPMETVENGCIVRTTPVLYISLRADITVNEVARQALIELMGPRAPRGLHDRKDIFVEQLELRRVELLIFDEAQHTLDRGAEKTQSKTRDWIKSLSKDTNIPMVLAGMASINPIVDEDEQVEQITPYRFELGRFSYDSAAEQRGFSTFLKDFDACLPFDELSLLGEPDRARRLHLATGGILRPLCQILRVAAAKAIEERARCIRDGDLSYGFDEIRPRSGCAHNPFEEDV